MRLDELRVHDVGQLRDVTLDLTGILPGLVALIGKNGAGKSTMLEMFPAAIGLGMPTREGLDAMATSRDAYVQAKVCNGQPWVIRHSLDNVSRTGEVLVTDAGGKPATDKAGRKAFKAWARDHMPTAEVFFSSIFAAQGKGGFATLGVSDRKACILRLLGVERLETQAKRCREEMRDAQGGAATARQRLADVENQVLSAERIVAQELVGAEDELELAKTNLATAEDELRAAERAVSEREVAAERETAIEKAKRRVGEVEAEIKAIEQKLHNNRHLRGNPEKIHAARKRADEIAIELPKARAAMAKAQEEKDLAVDRRATAQSNLDQLRAKHDDVKRRLAEAESIAMGAEQARAARDGLASIDLAGDEASLAVLRQALEALQGQQLTGAEGRIEWLRTGLISIRDQSTASDPPSVASATLDKDDRAVRRSVEHPAKLAEARAAVAEGERILAKGREAHARASALAARLPDIEKAEAASKALRAELAGLDLTMARQAVVEMQAHARDALAALEQAASGVKDLEREDAELKPTLNMESALAATDARIAELTEQLGPQQASLAKAQQELAALPQPVWPEARQVPEAQARLDVAKAAHATAQRRVSNVHAARDAAEPARVLRVERENERQAAEDEVADWALLADSLGRNGLQAIEADAAGPELSEIANDLLHNAFGPRFSVRFETTSVTSDGKDLKEDYDVVVVDTENNREGPLDTYSGGEKVVLAEGVALSLTTLNCRRNGLSDVTLVRDECGAALDQENALAYIAMLRRARALCSARHILFVSHDPQTWGLADTRVIFADGGIRVE